MAQGEQQQPQRMQPPLKNVQYINTPVNMLPSDQEGTREIIFVVTPIEQHSYTLVRPAQVDIARILIEDLDNDQKRELLDALAPGIEVAKTVPQGVKS